MATPINDYARAHEVAVIADFFEREYREEMGRIARFGGDLARARRLYKQWHAFREAASTPDYVHTETSSRIAA